MAEGGIKDLPDGKAETPTKPYIINTTQTTNLMIDGSERSIVIVQRDARSIAEKETKDIFISSDDPVLRLPPHMSEWTEDDIRNWMKDCLEIREPQADKFAEKVTNSNLLRSYNEVNLQTDFEFTEKEVDHFVNSRKAWLSKENDNKDYAISRVSEIGGASNLGFQLNVMYNITLHNAKDCIVIIEGNQLESDDRTFVDIPVSMVVTTDPVDSARQRLIYQTIYLFIKRAAQTLGIMGIREIVDMIEHKENSLIRIEKSSIRFIVRFYSQQSLNKFKERCLNGELAEELAAHLITVDDIRKVSGQKLNIQLTIEDTDYKEALRKLPPSGTSDPKQVQAVAQKAKEALKKVYPTTGTSDPKQVPAVAQKAKEALKKVYTTTGTSDLEQVRAVSSLVEKPYTHVRVEEFSSRDIKEYVNKFFPKDHEQAIKLIEQIELSDTWSKLAKSPELLLLMCLLWEADKTLPDTMTRLFYKALKYKFKRKTTDIKDDVIFKILISIGKVALNRLISKDQSFAFREGDFEKSALDAAINAGVLTSKRVIDGLDTYQSVSFMHHTFLEYCGAMYWQSLINTGEFKTILDRIDDHPGSSRRSCYVYLLRFCCGDNEACTNLILQKEHQDSKLAIKCYFESQSKELPPEIFINSVLSDKFCFPHWNYDRKNTFLCFLKRVTALSRGKNYFKDVKKLEWEHFNFQRSGKDLVELLKLMTDLQTLNLGFSSLTSANTKEILSLLATPTTLTRLDLSGNKALGGSVSSLAPQLKKLKCLKEMHLHHCSLVPEDVSPIAESVGDTLVHLNVQCNQALGGFASIWGPQMGKMECLQNINLDGCSLKATDIEPIGVSTLVNIDLSRNPDLGGCAEMWALHLKRMRHLQEVNLIECSLIDKDVEPIAVAVNDIQTLVHLNISGNEALGGCASMWALHLKKMNHLKKLILINCNLAEGDIKPIAESVSDMPTHFHLYMDPIWEKHGLAHMGKICSVPYGYYKGKTWAIPWSIPSAIPYGQNMQWSIWVS